MSDPTGDKLSPTQPVVPQITGNPGEKWWQDPHVWAMILADGISVLGIVSNYVPPKYGAGIIALSHALYSIDKIITGAMKNQNSTATDVVTTTSTIKTSVPTDPPHIEL